MLLIGRVILMSYNSNNMSFREYLNENLTNPADAHYAREWNKMLKEDKNRSNNSYYGSSYGGTMSVTTSNWGSISNCSPAFSSSYYG